MSGAVHYVTPRLRLSDLLRRPGGPPVVEAVATAETNLATLAPECREELIRQLEIAEAAHLRLNRVFDDAKLGVIYAAAVAAVGLGKVCGAPALDAVLTSLCDLVDDLRWQGRQDLDGVKVHLQAWRLLLASEAPPPQVLRLLDGLIRVSGRFAVPE
jgi:hypothetical protein